MSTTNQDYEYQNPDNYWKLVEETLQEVFNKGFDKLRECKELQSKVNEGERKERQIFYHAEPLDVAADLAGEPLTPEQVDKYLDIAKRYHWDFPN